MKHIVFILMLTYSVYSQGDGGIHPAYEITKLRALDFNVSVGGMDWLSDGRMVIAHYGETVWNDSGGEGKLFVLDNMSSEDPKSITRLEIANNLNHPLGLRVVDDKIYVLEKEKISVFVESAPGQFVNLPNETITGWDYIPGSSGSWAHGLIYKDNNFYFTLGAIWPDHNGSSNEAALKAQPKQRCTLIKASLSSKIEVVANGLRSPNGINLGVDGEIFFTDNQGRWFASNKLNHFKPSHHYGYMSAPSDTFLSNIKEPAIHIVQDKLGKSPTDLTVIKTGPFKGQMLIGDNHFGGLQRYFLEKVGGEYQGAGFKFSGGFEAGPSRMVQDGIGNIYVGGLGEKDAFAWNNKRYGLDKLTLKSNVSSFFDFLSIRSRIKGFEIEFTEAVDPATLTNNTFTLVQEQLNEGSMLYGCCYKNRETLAVKSIVLHPDGDKVYLELDDLKDLRVVHFTASGLQSVSGDTLWGNEAWYTLNAQSNTQPFPPVSVEGLDNNGRVKDQIDIFSTQNGIKVSNRGDIFGMYQIFNVKAELVQSGQVGKNILLKSNSWKRGVYFFSWEVATRRNTQKFIVR